MKRKFFSLFCLAAFMVGLSFITPSHPSPKSQHKQLVLNRLAGAGLFASFNAVLGLLHCYDLGDYPAGIKVDFGKSGYYFDPKMGRNFWSYYFDPIAFHPKLFSLPTFIADHTETDEKNATEFSRLGWHLSRERAAELIQKYIHIKPYLLKKSQDFVNQHFTKCTLGIHYRGTDKAEESARVSFEKVIATIDAVLPEFEAQDKIFVATDEIEFLQKLQTLYKERIIHTHCLRSASGEAVHLPSNYSPSKKGEEALLDCLLLSQCTILIRTDSCLSLTAARLNPRLTEIVVAP